MNNSNQTHLIDMHPPSTVLKPSLINQINMETSSPTPYSEKERMMLVEEVSDMKKLTGIIPMSPTLLMSTSSLKEYPRRMNSTWEETLASQVMNQETIVNMNQIADWKTKDDQIRNKESMNLKCHGSAKNSKSGN